MNRGQLMCKIQNCITADFVDFEQIGKIIEDDSTYTIAELWDSLETLVTSKYRPTKLPRAEYDRLLAKWQSIINQ